MSIREATVDDVPRLVEMGQRFRAESPYATRLTENPAQMRALVTQLLETESGIVFVEEQDDQIVGMFLGFLFLHPISGDLIGSEVVWWVEPEFRGRGLRLMRRGEAWAREHGARFMQMVAPTPDVAQLYRRLGYEEVEQVYQRRMT
jgi:GNAT superfamily N-acetyltransferase